MSKAKAPKYVWTPAHEAELVKWLADGPQVGPDDSIATAVRNKKKRLHYTPEQINAERIELFSKLPKDRTTKTLEIDVATPKISKSVPQVDHHKSTFAPPVQSPAGQAARKKLAEMVAASAERNTPGNGPRFDDAATPNTSKTVREAAVDYLKRVNELLTYGWNDDAAAGQASREQNGECEIWKPATPKSPAPTGLERDILALREAAAKVDDGEPGEGGNPRMPEPTDLPLVQAYELTGTDRIELLTPERAAARNSGRHDSKRWTLVTDPARAKVAIDAPLPLAGKERDLAFAAGLRKDDEAWQRMKAARKAAEAPAKDEKKIVEGVAKDGSPGPTAKKPGRFTWHDYTMCEVIRYIGRHFPEATVAEVLPVLSKLGFTAAEFTVKRQMGEARKGAVAIVAMESAVAQELEGHWTTTPTSPTKPEAKAAKTPKVKAAKAPKVDVKKAVKKGLKKLGLE